MVLSTASGYRFRGGLCNTDGAGYTFTHTIIAYIVLVLWILIPNQQGRAQWTKSRVSRPKKR